MSEAKGQLEEALSLALSLSSVDCLKLAARVVSSVESEMLSDQQSGAGENTPVKAPGKWGSHVVVLLDQVDLTDWEQMDLPDVGEWVRQLRHQVTERYERYWTGEE